MARSRALYSTMVAIGLSLWLALRSRSRPFLPLPIRCPPFLKVSAALTCPPPSSSIYGRNRRTDLPLVLPSFLPGMLQRFPLILEQREAAYDSTWVASGLNRSLKTMKWVTKRAGTMTAGIRQAAQSDFPPLRGWGQFRASASQTSQSPPNALYSAMRL